MQTAWETVAEICRVDLDAYAEAFGATRGQYGHHTELFLALRAEVARRLAGQ